MVLEHCNYPFCPVSKDSPSEMIKHKNYHKHHNPIVPGVLPKPIRKQVVDPPQICVCRYHHPPKPYSTVYLWVKHMRIHKTKLFKTKRGRRAYRKRKDHYFRLNRHLREKVYRKLLKIWNGRQVDLNPPPPVLPRLPSLPPIPRSPPRKSPASSSISGSSSRSPTPHSPSPSPTGSTPSPTPPTPSPSPTTDGSRSPSTSSSEGSVEPYHREMERYRRGRSPVDY